MNNVQKVITTHYGLNVLFLKTFPGESFDNLNRLSLEETRKVNDIIATYLLKIDPFSNIRDYLIVM